MRENIKEIEKIIEILKLKNNDEFKKTKEYEDNLYIIKQFSIFVGKKIDDFDKPELKELYSLIDSLTDIDKELSSFIEEVKKAVDLSITTNICVMDIDKLTNEPDLEKYQIEYSEDYEKTIGRIIDNYNYIKENSKEDSLEMYLVTKKLRELKTVHKELETMCDELLYNKEDKKVDIEELKKQKEKEKEAQLKNDKLEANIKSLSLEIVYYFNNPGFDLNKYKDFIDKLSDYDKELFELKDNMKEEQYNRVLEEFYRAQGNLEALKSEMLKQSAEEKTGISL